MNESRFYTTGEVASLCGVTLRTVINWIKKGWLIAHQLPGSRGDNRIRHDHLIIFMTNHKLPIPEVLIGSSLVSHLHGGLSSGGILVVDDDMPMAKAIVRCLRPLGKNITIAQDGFEAGLHYGLLQPNLMTLDLQMPKFDGFAVLKALQGKKIGKVLVISAMEDYQLEQALGLGADAVLAKPFDSTELIAIAEGMLNSIM